MFLAPNVFSPKCGLLSCNYGFSLMFPPAMGPIYSCQFTSPYHSIGGGCKRNCKLALAENFFQELEDIRDFTKIKDDINVIYFCLSLSSSEYCLFRHLGN